MEQYKMKQYKKVMIYIGICMFCFAEFDSLQIKNSLVSIKKIDVFAADDENKKSAKDDSVADDQKESETDGEQPCPECPECPDPAKVVLRGLEEKKNKD